METTNATTIPIYQDQYLCTSKSKAKFQNLQKTGSEHNRDSKEEGEFSCNGTGSTNQDSSNDGRTRSGCTRNNGKHLETADEETPS